MMSDVAGITHVGLVRKENQDGFLAESFGSGGNATFQCLAVADGMGGHDKGRLASARAIETVRDRLNELMLASGGSGPDEAWCEALESDAHSEVSKIAAEGEVTGTTLSVALVSGEECYIGHVGDSRIYRLRDGQLNQLTEDHIWDASSAYGNKLRQAVGVGKSIEPELLRIKLQKGDWLLVCSDGLHKMVSDRELERTLSRARNAKAGCDQLLRLALKAGGKDNVAICVGRVGRARHRANYRLAVVVAFVVIALSVALYWVLTRRLT